MLKLLNGESKSITSAALIVGAASLFSRVIGLLRDRILAGEFGAGEQLDVYFAAFRIPDFLYQLLILGALSAGFIPIFSRLKHERADRAWAFAGTVLHTVVVSISILAFFLFLLMPWITPLMTPGFSVRAQHDTVFLSRIMLLSPLFLGMSALFGGILQASRLFFLNALAPIFYNIGIICGVLYFVPVFGIAGLAWGVVLGAFLHAAIQFPSVWRLGLRYRLVSPARDREMRTLARLMIPRICALGVTQATLVAMTIIASTLAKGSLTAFNFANNIASLPIGLFGVTYAIAAFPAFTEHIVHGNVDGFRRSFAATIRHVLFFVVPSTIVLLLLRAQIVRAVLGAGAFDWEDTIHTMNTLAALAVGLFATSINYVLIRGFWAYEDTWTPAIMATIGSILSVAAAVFLRSMWGVTALGVALSAGAVVQLALSWLLLRMRAQTLNEQSILLALAKISCGALFLAIGVQGTKVFLGTRFGTDTLLDIVVQGAGAVLVGGVFYCIVCWMLRSKELLHFIASVRRRITPKPEQLELFEQ